LIRLKKIAVALLRYIAWFIVACFSVFLLAIFLLYLPPIQRYLVQYANKNINNYVEGKASIGAVHLGFPLNVVITDVSIADAQLDTIASMKTVDAGLAIWPLLSGNIEAGNINLEGLRLKLAVDETGNLNLASVFSAKDTASVEKPKENAGSGGLKISAQGINIKDVALEYSSSGMEFHILLNQLKVGASSFDVDRMRVINKSLFLSGADIRLRQLNENIPAVDHKINTENDKTPFLLQNSGIQLKDIKFFLQTETDSSLFVSSGRFLVDQVFFDLAKQDIQCGVMSSEGLFVKLFEETKKMPAEKPADSISSFVIQPGFETGWTLHAPKLDFKKSNARIHVLDSSKAIELEYLSITDVVFTDQENHANVDLKGLKINDINLHNLKTNLLLNDQGISLNAFQCVLDSMEFNAKAQLQHSMPINPEQLMRLPFGVQCSIDGRLPSVFSRFISPNYLPLLQSRDIHLFTAATSSQGYWHLDSLMFQFGASVNLHAHGKLNQDLSLELPDADLNMRLNYLKNKEIAFLVHQYMPDLWLPDSLQLQLKSTSDHNRLISQMRLNSEIGQLDVDANFQSDSVYRCEIFAQDLHLEEFLKQDSLGPLNFKIKANGKGLRPGTSSLALLLSAYDVQYKRVLIDSLFVDVDVNNELGNLKIRTVSDYLSMQLNARGGLKNAEAHLQLKNLKTAVLLNKIAPDIKGLASFYWLDTLRTRTISADFKDFELNNGNMLYEVKPIILSAFFSDSSSRCSLNSGILNLEATANMQPEPLLDALDAFFERSLQPDYSDSSKGKAHLTAHMSFDDDSPLFEYLLPGLKRVESSEAHLEFVEENDHLSANFLLPWLEYGKWTMNAFDLSAELSHSQLESALHIASVKYDSIEISPLYFTTDIRDSSVYGLLSIGEKERGRFALGASLRRAYPGWLIHLDTLIANDKLWQAKSTENYMLLDTNGIRTAFIEVQQDQQEFTFVKDSAVFECKSKDLSLDDLLAFVRPTDSTELFGGLLSVHYKSIDKKIMNAQFALDSLRIAEFPPLNINAILHPDEEINHWEASIVSGFFEAEASFVQSDHPTLNAELQQFDLSYLSDLMPSVFNRCSGSLSAKLQAETMDKISGSASFHQAAINLKALNSVYYMNEERIDFTQDGLLFKQFKLADSAKNEVVINGGLLKKDTSFILDLSVDAKNFLFLNSFEQEGIPYYGKVNADVALLVKGPIIAPKINAELKLNNGSDFSYIYASDRLNLIDDKDVVAFAEINPGDSLLHLPGDTVRMKTMFRGMSLDAGIKVEKNAIFRLYADFSSEDYIEIQGDADLDLKMQQDGNIRLSGRYEVAEGFYQMSFYNLVKKRFYVSSGSNINWYGSPSEARVDLTTSYSTKVAPLNLMLTQVSGLSEGQKQRYRQKIPFKVYLYMKGELLSPQISFSLELDKEYRMRFPDVDAYVQELNRDGNTDELNKQVFGILVFNSFMADASDGDNPSDQMAENIAMSSVNGLLNSQLNRFSGKYLSGVEIEMNLDNYTSSTEGTASQTNLDINVSKRFMNNRLQVVVGESFALSGNTSANDPGVNDLAGSYAVIYDLTEDGKIRIKAYRESAWDMIDGSVEKTGFSIIFEKEFMLKSIKVIEK